MKPIRLITAGTSLFIIAAAAAIAAEPPHPYFELLQEAENQQATLRSSPLLYRIVKDERHYPRSWDSLAESGDGLYTWQDLSTGEPTNSGGLVDDDGRPYVYLGGEFFVLEWEEQRRVLNQFAVGPLAGSLFEVRVDGGESFATAQLAPAFRVERVPVTSMPTIDDYFTEWKSALAMMRFGELSESADGSTITISQSAPLPGAARFRKSGGGAPHLESWSLMWNDPASEVFEATSWSTISGITIPARMERLTVNEDDAVMLMRTYQIKCLSITSSQFEDFMRDGIGETIVSCRALFDDKTSEQE